MPYKQVWFDASKDENIEVYRDLPPEYHERKFGLWGVKQAELNVEYWKDDKELWMYECHHCNGWIKGEPNKYEINTLRPSQLAGRQGTEFYCRRCGNQIGFMGIMS